MRLVKVNAPAGLGVKVKETAFAVGIKSISVYKVTTYDQKGEQREEEVTNFETSTPKAKHFIDRLLTEDYFDRDTISLNVRQPRTILSKEDIRELTTPLEEPPTDLFEELWQFS